MTTAQPDRERLASALAAAGAAHHEAFIETDGEDPEWPSWYADHLVGELRGILQSPDLTESRIVGALVAADQAYRTENPPAGWPEFYAERLLRDLGTT